MREKARYRKDRVHQYEYTYKAINDVSVALIVNFRRKSVHNNSLGNTKLILMWASKTNIKLLILFQNQFQVFQTEFSSSFLILQIFNSSFLIAADENLWYSST